MIDLHVHSTRSDGTYSPTQLVDYAITKGLHAFALTDHDTIDGLTEAIQYADTLRCNDTSGNVLVPEIIPGIELSTEYQGRDIHIVGLYLDYHNQAFQDYLQNFITSRDLRNQKMCSLLSEAGIDISYEKLLEEFPNSVITRAHYAKYFLKHGYTKSIKEGFERYVGDHCPYFVPREKVTPEQAIDLILKADGIPILAHPILYGMSSSRLEELVALLKEAGLIGIEAVYSTYTPADERQIRRLAEKYHLLISGGSDFHGDNKPGLDLGIGYGHLYVPDELLSNIKQARKNILFSDMDGTLLKNNSTVSDSMKEALDTLSANGHRLVLSSGRPLSAILEVVKQAALDYPNTLIISYNGALIYSLNDQKPIHECKISQEDIRLLDQLAKQEGLHIHGYGMESIICNKPNEELDFYRKRIHLPLECIADIAEACPDGSYKMQCIHLTDHDRLEEFRQKTIPLFEGRIQMIFSNDKYLEILPAKASKGSALKFTASYLSVPISHTFAAGDEENDISMLQAAGLGIAMLNATEKVKEAADYVTKSTNEEDGLLPILNQYFQ